VDRSKCYEIKNAHLEAMVERSLESNHTIWNAINIQVYCMYLISALHLFGIYKARK
jgi:hypothetical protein